MHYSVDYGAYDSFEKRLRALNDIVDYIGWAKFNEVSGLLLKSPPDPKSWLMLSGMLGVNGYPATAWYDFILKAGTDWQEVWKEMQ